jgi:hypothetical protein
MIDEAYWILAALEKAIGMIAPDAGVCPRHAKSPTIPKILHWQVKTRTPLLELWIPAPVPFRVSAGMTDYSYI